MVLAQTEQNHQVGESERINGKLSTTLKKTMKESGRLED